MTIKISTELRSVKSEFVANTITNLNQLAPDALALSNGGFVVAYNNFDLNDGSIRLNFYDANYVKVGTAKPAFDGVHTDAVGEPSLTQLANGNVLVVWDDNNQVNGAGLDDSGLKAAIFDQTGNKVKGEFDLAGDWINYSGADVTALNNGNFVVSYGINGNFNQMSFRLFKPNGDKIGTEVKVNLFDDGTQKGGQVTALSTGGFVVSWIQDTGDGTPVGRGRIYDSNGALKSSTVLSNDCKDLAITGLDNGNFAVVVREDAAAFDLKLKICKADGTVLNFATMGLSTDKPATQPDIVQLESGHILVSWSREHKAGDNDIWASLFDSAGNKIKVDGLNEFAINSGGFDDVKSAIAAIEGGTFLTAWQDSEPHDGQGSTISAEINEFVGVGKGDSGADTYAGTTLRDEVDGGAGKDTLSGGDGNDFIDGGAGNDLLNGGQGNDTIYGGADNDIIHGAVGHDPRTWSGADELHGEGGNDTIVGYSGNDTISGGSGKDIINAQQGDDTIHIQKGDVVAGEIIDGGDGNDILLLDDSNVSQIVSIRGASLSNIETIKFRGVFGDPQTWVASAGQFWGGNEDMTIDGHNSQKDTFIITMNETTNANLAFLNMELSSFPGFEDSVFIIGDDDAETIRGTEWAETIDGAGGGDTLYGSNGDTLLGGGGDDVLHDVLGHIKFDGGAGNDTVSYAVSPAVIAALDGSVLNNGGASGDQFVSIENLIGSAKNDRLIGDGGANRIEGGLGNDTIDGGTGGADTFVGGAGDDTFTVNSVGDQVIEVDGVNQGLDTVNSSVSFSLGGQFIENLNLTGAGNIDGTGNSLANKIVGNDGTNVLRGGLGLDTLTGGANGDRFVFDTALGATNVDQVTDFFAPEDSIRIDNAVFIGLTDGLLAASAFKNIAGGANLDADDRILYDASKGELYFDQDGSGVTYGLQLFAYITNNEALTAADFLVI